MRILLVEDSRVTRVFTHHLLTSWGLECLSVNDGVEAVERFAEFNPHIIVTDWMMPRMDGVELVKRIRRYCDSVGTYVYIIMLTAKTETSNLVEGLNAGADDFVKKPLNKEEFHARIRAGIRIIELERALSRKNDALITANREITAANRRMRRELEAAARIQSSFLPAHLPETGDTRFAWVYEPCDELSGDTLNILPLDDRKVGLYVVDVCGHGVTAALLSVHVSRLFTRMDDPDSLVRPQKGGNRSLEAPVKVASHLNELFPFDPKDENPQYFTMLYGILDLDKNRFDYTSAGHPGPIIVPGDRSRGVIVHEAYPPAVGFFGDAQFTQKQIDLDKGDRLYLYTDGIFEMLNTECEPFGERRLAKTLFEQRDHSLEDSIHGTLEIARKWNRKDKFEDDISLVGLEVG